MGRIKIDLKVRLLIERCIKTHERSLFLILGQSSRDQIVLLHHVFLQVRNNIQLSKPSILWCYKKDNGFNFICHKKQQILKKKYSKNYPFCEEDVFAHFLASTTIQFCHYNDTFAVLGQTFNMLIIQDFEAITPNILACIIECIEGGGIIIMIFPSVQTLQEITSIKMDAHSKYVTSAHPNIDPIFNFRFVLSLAECKNCMILDDDLKILHCPTDLDSVDISQLWNRQKFKSATESVSGEDFDKLISLCCTADQQTALETFIGVLKEKCTTRSVLSLTSARGRGKSATLGLAISCALTWKYSRIYVTSPYVENVQTLFKFIVNGMKAFDYKEGEDYNVIYNTVENQKLIFGMNIFRGQKQTVHYLLPTEFTEVGSSDFVVIDEAAAIPLPIVKKWLKSDLVFMASTINGYEGTGRSLSLKLMNQLREKSQQFSSNESLNSSEKSFILHERTLNEAIRYTEGDKIEAWLNKLFCLDVDLSYLSGTSPKPEECQLYYVNKKVLFSYQKVAEKFLQQLTALFVSSHYKNSPNDLLMIADNPSYHLFCLLPPVNTKENRLPDVLCVIQIGLEGKIPKDCVIQEISHGKRPPGGLIPWVISQQFQDSNFPSLAGARVVRIATHPNIQRMGYGQRALNLLFSYYRKNSELGSSNPSLQNKEPTLLLNLDEVEQNKLNYIGVSYGLTLELLKFWKKLDFVPLYLRQTASETTGEHSCVMIKYLEEQKPAWLLENSHDFLQRFLTLLASAFRNLPTYLALEILHYKRSIYSEIEGSFTDVGIHSVLTKCSVQRLEAYCNHLVDYHLIMDLIPVLAKCYFFNYFQDYFLSSIQECILLSMGLQNKSVEQIAEEINKESGQVMGIFMKITKKILQHFSSLESYLKPNKNLQTVESCKNNSCNSEKLEFKRKNQNPYQKIKKRKKYDSAS